MYNYQTLGMILLIVVLGMAGIKFIINYSSGYAGKVASDIKQSFTKFDKLAAKSDIVIEGDGGIIYSGSIPTDKVDLIIPGNAKLMCVATRPEKNTVFVSLQGAKEILVAGIKASSTSSVTISGHLLKGSIRVGEELKIQLIPEVELGERLINGKAQRVFHLTAKATSLFMRPQGKVYTKSRSSMSGIEDFEIDDLGHTLSLDSHSRKYYYRSNFYFLSK